MPNKNAPKSSSMFDDFNEIVEASDGLKSLKETKIILTKEQRTKNVPAVVTPTEKSGITKLSYDLTVKLDKRVTVSDIGRELFLLATGQEIGDENIRKELIVRLKEII